MSNQALIPTLLVTATMMTAPSARSAVDQQTVEALKHASYQGIYAVPVRLTDGRYEGEPYLPGAASRPRLTLIDGLIARGDLNGDDADEAVVLLVESAGGSGSFVHLAAMSISDGAPENLATTRLGDRVQVRELRIADGAVAVETVMAGPGDSAAIPATKARRVFRLADRSLTETAAQDGGTLSLADLEGTAWTLQAMVAAGERRVPVGTITAEFRDGRIVGSAGCNRYFTSVEDQGRGGLEIGQVGSTRMACPEPLMQQERSYLEQLERVRRFGFRFGDLVLSGPGGELVFSPKADGGSSGR
jgi:heat shock protein HslJ